MSLVGKLGLIKLLFSIPLPPLLIASLPGLLSFSVTRRIMRSSLFGGGIEKEDGGGGK